LYCKPGEYLHQLIFNDISSISDESSSCLLPPLLEQAEAMLNLGDGGLVIASKRLKASE
jgi:hypothetical protein